MKKSIMKYVINWVNEYSKVPTVHVRIWDIKSRKTFPESQALCQGTVLITWWSRTERVFPVMRSLIFIRRHRYDVRWKLADLLYYNPNVLSGLVNPSGTGSSSYFSVYALHDYKLSVMLRDFAMWFVLYVIDHTMSAAQFMNVELMKNE